MVMKHIQTFESVNEAVKVEVERYKRSHQKNPNGFGSWAFSYNRQGIGHFFTPQPMDYKEAVKWAKEEAKRDGEGYIYVMESVNEGINKSALKKQIKIIDKQIDDETGGDGEPLTDETLQALTIERERLEKLLGESVNEGVIGIKTEGGFKPKDLSDALDKAKIKYKMNRLSTTLTVLNLDKNYFEDAKKIVDDLGLNIMMAKESVNEGKVSVKKGEPVLYKGNGTKWVESEFIRWGHPGKTIHIEWNDEYTEVPVKDVKKVPGYKYTAPTKGNPNAIKIESIEEGANYHEYNTEDLRKMYREIARNGSPQQKKVWKQGIKRELDKRGESVNEAKFNYMKDSDEVRDLFKKITGKSGHDVLDSNTFQEKGKDGWMLNTDDTPISDAMRSQFVDAVMKLGKKKGWEIKQYGDDAIEIYESVNEAKEVEVTQEMWDKEWKIRKTFGKEYDEHFAKRIEAAMSKAKNEEMAENWAFINWKQLPSKADGMTIKESVNEAKEYEWDDLLDVLMTIGGTGKIINRINMKDPEVEELLDSKYKSYPDFAKAVKSMYNLKESVNESDNWKTVKTKSGDTLKPGKKYKMPRYDGEITFIRFDRDNKTLHLKSNKIGKIRTSINNVKDMILIESTHKYIKTFEVATQVPAKMIAFDGDDEDDEDLIKKGKKMKGPLGMATYLGVTEDDEDEEESEIEKIRKREGRIPGPKGGVGYAGKERG